MAGTNEISILLDKLDILMRRQEMFSQEIALLREEITRLRDNENNEVPYSGSSARYYTCTTAGSIY